MEYLGYVPDSARAAGRAVRFALAGSLQGLSKADFLAAWFALAYLFPGLHPDGFEEADSGWPRVLRRFPAEAWRRAEAGELEDEELYPCDAQWSGLCDRMANSSEQAAARRQVIMARGSRVG